MKRSRTPAPAPPSGNENAWITLRELFAARERKLVSTHPQTIFRPTRLITPASALQFLIGGRLMPPGESVDLPNHGVQFAHVGDLVVFEVWNESDEPETLDVRVYGIAARDETRSGGECGVPGVSGAAPGVSVVKFAKDDKA